MHYWSWVCKINERIKILMSLFSLYAISKSVNFITSRVDVFSFEVWILSWVIQIVCKVHFLVSSHVHLQTEHTRSVSTKTLSLRKNAPVHDYALSHMRSIHDWQVLQVSAFLVYESVSAHLLSWVALHVSIHCGDAGSHWKTLWFTCPFWESLVPVIHVGVLESWELG